MIENGEKSKADIKVRSHSRKNSRARSRHCCKSLEKFLKLKRSIRRVWKRSIESRHRLIKFDLANVLMNLLQYMRRIAFLVVTFPSLTSRSRLLEPSERKVNPKG